ncbi:MAG: hypothetical protein M1816_007325 [Peltula sp. TS41687]|nr:MAG: hypothetical protein M1816_007325 [Peltula sp. TS41687]
MSRKRKRIEQGPSSADGPRKRQRKRRLHVREEHDTQHTSTPSAVLDHPSLSPYYSRMISLRAHLLSKLPPTSKLRRRRLASRNGQDRNVDREGSRSDGLVTGKQLSDLLDFTLVGVPEDSSGLVTTGRVERALFTQPQSVSTSTSALDASTCSQFEVIDYAIWLLFQRVYRTIHRPPHMLCHGYQRSSNVGQMNQVQGATSGIPGIHSYYPNDHVNRLKSPIWAEVLRLLGKDGDSIMLDLVVNQSIFLPVERGHGNYYQISDLKPLHGSAASLAKQNALPATGKPTPPKNQDPSDEKRDLHSPGNIVLVRNRMLYARAALNAKGQVQFGLRHIHVLNRYPDATNIHHVVRIMAYIFPRQFGLHNVFTSAVDPRETAQPFKDYTMREEELRRREHHIPIARHDQIPKRLRGKLADLICKMQKLHSRCSYKELLEYYCSVTVSQPARLGGALFSVGDIYLRLKSFKDSLAQLNREDSQLLFVKVDVQSCFDTIPQRKVVQLMERLTSEDDYRVRRHVEIRPSEASRQHGSRLHMKPIRKFIAKARSPTDLSPFHDMVERELSKGKKNSIFVDRVVQSLLSKKVLLALLEEHIARNLVKVGKKFYRQKTGIPQGSVLSSILCNFFYADFEGTRLGFLEASESILLRLIDDFLLITMNREHAERFLRVMHQGDSDYGISVNPAKSQTNFSAELEGFTSPKLIGGHIFPFCGTLIDTKTLEISKDREKSKGGCITDSLTVEFSKLPGQTFHRKALNAFKIQAHAMFLDTNFNSTITVLTNIYENFIESAMKFYRYARSLPSAKQPRAAILIKTIEDLIELAFALTKSKSKQDKFETFNCAVTKTQVRWLALTAFQAVLSRKQSKYRPVLDWLKTAIAVATASMTKSKSSVERTRLRRVVRHGQRTFRNHRY